ncbi:MAG: hypothetical protein GC190_21800 [Alphaproteobacteria bacterium]|nr:hypothetical protein [Alphaproteobacteria bacterium]
MSGASHGANRKSRAMFVVERRPLRSLALQPSVLIAGLPSPALQAPRAWASRAGWELRLKRYRRVRGPVRLTLTFERAPRGRLDLMTRAAIDLLTATNLIDGDGPDVLKELMLHWGAGKGLQILIQPWSERA